MAILWNNQTDIDAARVEEAADDQPDEADGLRAPKLRLEMQLRAPDDDDDIN